MMRHVPSSILALQPTSSSRPLRRSAITSWTGTFAGSISTISCKFPTSSPNTKPSWGTRMDLPVWTHLPPPKVSCPIPSPSNFVQVISRRLHNDLVIKIPKEIQTSAPSKSALPGYQPKTKPGDVIFPQLNNIPAPVTLVLPAQPNPVRIELDLLGNAVIIRGTNEKRRILDEYEQKFQKNYDASIVSKKKGKITDDPPMLARTTCMRPSLDKWYRVLELTILNVIMTVIKEQCLTPSELKTIHLLDKIFSIMVPKVTHWLKIDFYPLCKP